MHLFETKMVKKMENKGAEIKDADNSTSLDKKVNYPMLKHRGLRSDLQEQLVD